jgi:UDP-N-acetylmuramate dehydrogenase
MNQVNSPIPVIPQELMALFENQVQFNIPMSRWTSTRVGGPADALLIINSITDLAKSARICWEVKYPFNVLGSGSNVLISDKGVRGIVLINATKKITFNEESSEIHPSVWAESGTNLSALARQASRKGLSGLEWACGIPGSIGGAIFGNAGAHGSDMASNLLMAEILHHNHYHEALSWTNEDLEFSYRGSRLKREPQTSYNQPQTVILSANLKLMRDDPQEIEKRLLEYQIKRRRTQPPGASMGSIFKNPSGDYAGRLIDAAGLKGFRIGDAEISTVHANFFVNTGSALAQDFIKLIRKVQEVVSRKFGVELELEIQILGEWGMELG